MAAVEQTTPAPLLANIIVILGFVSVFSSFATDAAASWIIGVALIVAGGIWAGFAGRTSATGAVEPAPTGGQSHGGAH